MNRLVAWLIFPHQTYLFKQTSLPGVVVEIFFSLSLDRQVLVPTEQFLHSCMNKKPKKRCKTT
jgi:hypothetical protein